MPCTTQLSLRGMVIDNGSTRLVFDRVHNEVRVFEHYHDGTRRKLRCRKMLKFDSMLPLFAKLYMKGERKMTLGTNATLEERLKYAPDEITPDEIAKVLDELADWRELLSDEFDGPDDIKARLEELEDDIARKDRDIEDLETEVDELSQEINYLNNRNAELESELQERP